MKNRVGRPATGQQKRYSIYSNVSEDENVFVKAQAKALRMSRDEWLRTLVQKEKKRVERKHARLVEKHSGGYDYERL